ncbi:hypothetical protein FQR65_LT02514 [Abscondita terminalis]|nr:hypothetical protein FQR65_LT02514 [Abscondita terminalis]
MEIILELPRDIDKLCRSCMNLIDNDNYAANFVIFDNKQTELGAMLRTVTSLKITTQDGLPKSLCSSCVEQLQSAYKFILQCTQVDQNLKKILESTECINGETSVKNFKQTDLKQLGNDLDCKYCSKSFITYYELSMHIISHNTSKNLVERLEEPLDRKFEIVDSEVEEQKLFIEEYRKNLTVPILVASNKKTFINNLKPNKKWPQCRNCHKKFRTEDNLYLHTSNGCTKENSASYKVPLCVLCDKQCKDFSTLSLHFLNHSLGLEMSRGKIVSEVHFCEFCGQLFEDNSSLIIHYNEHHENHPSWDCSNCLESFDKERDCLSHEALVHGYDVDEDEVDCTEEIQCVLCSENFGSKSELHKHSLTHLMRRYSCRKCSHTFCTKLSYFAHLQVHSGDKYVCSLCGKCLSTNSALKSHTEGVHPVELLHCCSICGKRFATYTRLKTHSKIHTTEKKYICSYCGYSSHKSGDLAMHTRIHTSERPYKCTFSNCAMSFKTSSHLCHHVRRHLQIKKFKCSICLLKFSTNHGLKVHHMQHTGEKPHTCLVCKRTFRRKYHLTVHMKQHSRS